LFSTSYTIADHRLRTGLADIDPEGRNGYQRGSSKRLNTSESLWILLLALADPQSTPVRNDINSQGLNALSVASLKGQITSESLYSMTVSLQVDLMTSAPAELERKLPLDSLDVDFDAAANSSSSDDCRFSRLHLVITCTELRTILAASMESALLDYNDSILPHYIHDLSSAPEFRHLRNLSRTSLSQTLSDRLTARLQRYNERPSFSHSNSYDIDPEVLEPIPIVSFPS
jgi:hypothetical protein